MSYRHPYWYESEPLYRGNNPHIQLLEFLLVMGIVPLNIFLGVLLSAIGFVEIWIPLVCIELVGVFLYRWYRP